MVTVSQAIGIGVAGLFIGGAVGAITMALVSINRYAKDDFGRDEVGARIVRREDGGITVTFAEGMDPSQVEDLKHSTYVLFRDLTGHQNQDGGANPQQLPFTYPSRIKPRKQLTAKQAARKIGMSTRWLYDHSRDLPFTVKTGRRSLRFDSMLLDEWLAKRREGRTGATVQ